MRVLLKRRLNSLWQRTLTPLLEAHPEIELIEMPTADPAARPTVKQSGPVGEGTPGQASMADAASWTEAEVVIGGSVSAEDVEAMPALRAVIVPFTGVNGLPLELLRDRGVRIANSHGNARYVAERALAMLLSLTGRICRFDADLRRGRWHGFAAGEPIADSWESLDGKTAAILGTGAIGRETAKLLRPFGVTTRGLRRSDGPVDAVFDAAAEALDEALRGADIVVVTLPATEETRGLLGSRELELMAGGILVNVGRGSVVQQRALYEALAGGTLAGACIDTWYNYPDRAEGTDPARRSTRESRPPSGTEEAPQVAPPTETAPADYPFWKLENTVLSPHVGGYTPRAGKRSIEETVENLRLFVEEGRFLNDVFPEREY